MSGPGMPADRGGPADHDVPADREVADEGAVSAEQMSLVRRLRQPRTIVSLVLPLVLLVLIFRVALQVDVDELAAGFGRADGLLLLAAFVVYYLGFPLRGARWSFLVAGTGFRLRTRDATEIIFLSWLVNCLVPAKLGDVYRAYLLKINSTVSLSRTFGTVFIERVLDLVAISVLGIAAGYWSFRTEVPPTIQLVFAIGIGVVVVLVAGMLTLRSFGRRIVDRLPRAERFRAYYERFEEGVFGAVGARRLLPLAAMTGLIWATEAIRLYLVVGALSLPDVSIGLSGAFFVALIGSLLTAIPLSPAGLGFVELGVVGVLTAAYGVPLTEATLIALVDRTISVFSIIVLGSFAYAVSSKRRGEGLSGVTGPEATPAG